MGVSRRSFLVAAGGAAAAIAMPGTAPGPGASLPGYAGPNVVLVRFGGGVRRQETIVPGHSYSPYFLHDLVPRGVLFPAMGIDQFQDINTSHGEGTLYLLTGKYQKFRDVEGRFLGGRFESSVPTLFEYFRAAFAVPEHEALIVNGEDRTDEEFYNFSNHHLFGVQYRSATLSLFRYKAHLLRRQLSEGGLDEKAVLEKSKLLAQMEGLDYRATKERGQPEAIERFWDGWRAHYGESGLRNARGDALLTQLAVRAMEELRPRLLMINYNDPDYVHWGNPAHYYNGISVIDRGMRQIVEASERLETYRGNTVFVIVPDCGRDANRAQAVPFQHHFNSRSAHEIFALVFGAGIEAGKRVDRPVDQTSIAATVAGLMGFRAGFAEAAPLEEVFV
jgi:hypothetical protein